MIEKNYKLLYDIEPFRDAIKQAEQKKREADKGVTQAEKNYREACAKLSGISIDNLEFSDASCMARGILYHVYHIKVRHAPHGSIENKCIFCGSDNAEDFY